MSSPEWNKVEEVFQEALEVPTGERAGWVAARCGSDAELRREVESLLMAEGESEEFLNRPGLLKAVGALLGADDAHARQIGPYKILREVGRGGMGVVYLAAREEAQFRQRVAIKVVRRGLDTEDVLRRFRNERQILASLNHPNIAKVFDGGETSEGLPYFVMEYVEGLPLFQYCDEHDLSTEERLRLFRTICSAVSHAHQNLVIHRDLKPSNVLVTHMGEVKLLDFGVAKLLNPELTGGGITQTVALRVMTPEYASPEQVRGSHVTTATDVYSLGVILYELLTGVRPYELKDSSPEELSRMICDSEPSKPSDAVSRRLSGNSRETDSKKHASHPHAAVINPKLLRGDLDNIVLMAMRKEPTRRYKSVEQFSEDIERHLKGLPVLARKDTFSYRASKFVQRHKAGVGAAAVVILAVIAGLVGTIWQARVARQERDRARIEQLKAERIGEFLSAALTYADPSAAVAGTKNRRDATINQMLDEFAPRIEAELADQPEVRASLQRTVGQAYASQLRFPEAERYLRAALETQLKIYGAGHGEVAYTLASLANLQGAKGDYVSAAESLDQSISIYRQQPPVNSTHVKAFAAALTTYGGLHWTKGDLSAAESSYAEALAHAAKLEGKDREALADAKLGLGITRYAQGRLNEATALLRESLAEYRGMLHTRWKWSDALNFLGQVLTWRGEYEEALSHLQESEKLSLEIWGENNAFYPRSLWLRVYALCFKGECAAAEEPLRRAEEVYQRYFPDNKVMLANLFDARNLFLTRTGRASEGESFGRKSVELYQASMNRGAPSITLARVNWAESLMAQKKHEEAERVLLEAYRDASEMQGADHWRTKTAAHALVRLYEAWNRPDLAARYRNAAPAK